MAALLFRCFRPACLSGGDGEDAPVGGRLPYKCQSAAAAPGGPETLGKGPGAIAPGCQDGALPQRGADGDAFALGGDGGAVAVPATPCPAAHPAAGSKPTGLPSEHPDPPYTEVLSPFVYPLRPPVPSPQHQGSAGNTPHALHPNARPHSTSPDGASTQRLATTKLNAVSYLPITPAPPQPASNPVSLLGSQSSSGSTPPLPHHLRNLQRPLPREQHHLNALRQHHEPHNNVELAPVSSSSASAGPSASSRSYQPLPALGLGSVGMVPGMHLTPGPHLTRHTEPMRPAICPGSAPRCSMHISGPQHAVRYTRPASGPSLPSASWSVGRGGPSYGPSTHILDAVSLGGVQGAADQGPAMRPASSHVMAAMCSQLHGPYPPHTQSNSFQYGALLSPSKGSPRHGRPSRASLSGLGLPLETSSLLDVTQPGTGLVPEAAAAELGSQAPVLDLWAAGAQVSPTVKIAHGAYGVVYRGLWHGCNCAVKVMLAASTENLSSQLTEVFLCKALSCHPNIVQTFDCNVWRVTQDTLTMAQLLLGSVAPGPDSSAPSTLGGLGGASTVWNPVSSTLVGPLSNAGPASGLGLVQSSSTTYGMAAGPAGGGTNGGMMQLSLDQGWRCTVPDGRSGTEQQASTAAGPASGPCATTAPPTGTTIASTCAEGDSAVLRGASGGASGAFVSGVAPHAAADGRLLAVDKPALPAGLWEPAATGEAVQHSGSAQGAVGPLPIKAAARDAHRLVHGSASEAFVSGISVQYGGAGAAYGSAGSGQGGPGATYGSGGGVQAPVASAHGSATGLRNSPGAYGSPHGAYGSGGGAHAVYGSGGSDYSSSVASAARVPSGSTGGPGSAPVGSYTLGSGQLQRPLPYPVAGMHAPGAGGLGAGQAYHSPGAQAYAGPGSGYLGPVQTYTGPGSGYQGPGQASSRPGSGCWGLGGRPPPLYAVAEERLVTAVAAVASRSDCAHPNSGSPHRQSAVQPAAGEPLGAVGAAALGAQAGHGGGTAAGGLLSPSSGPQQQAAQPATWQAHVPREAGHEEALLQSVGGVRAQAPGEGAQALPASLGGAEVPVPPVTTAAAEPLPGGSSGQLLHVASLAATRSTSLSGWRAQLASHGHAACDAQAPLPCIMNSISEGSAEPCHAVEAAAAAASRHGHGPQAAALQDSAFLARITIPEPHDEGGASPGLTLPSEGPAPLRGSSRKSSPDHPDRLVMSPGRTSPFMLRAMSRASHSGRQEPGSHRTSAAGNHESTQHDLAPIMCSAISPAGSGVLPPAVPTPPPLPPLEAASGATAPNSRTYVAPSVEGSGASAGCLPMLPNALRAPAAPALADLDRPGALAAMPADVSDGPGPAVQESGAGALGGFPSQGPGASSGHGGFPSQGPGASSGHGGFPSQGPGASSGAGGFPSQGPGASSGVGGFPSQGPGTSSGVGGFPSQGPGASSGHNGNGERVLAHGMSGEDGDGECTDPADQLAAEQGARSFAQVLQVLGAKPDQLAVVVVMEECDRSSLQHLLNKATAAAAMLRHQQQQELLAQGFSISLQSYADGAHGAVGNSEEWSSGGPSAGLYAPFNIGGRYSTGAALKALVLTAKEVSLGMLFLHRNNIVHGDLKPGNVLLKSSRADQRGFVAKLSDFGLSRVLHRPELGRPLQPYVCAPTDSFSAPRSAAERSSASNWNPEAAAVLGACGGPDGSGTGLRRPSVGALPSVGGENSARRRWGQLDGTVPYMAPELIEEGQRSKASDVWAFGILLWCLVTGKRPYDGLLPMQVMAAVVSDDAEKLLPWPRHVHPVLAQIGKACTALEPHRRPTFSQIVSRLQQLEAALRAEGYT